MEKLREAARLNQSDSSRVQLTAQMLPLKLDSRLLAELIQSNLHMLTPITRSCWRRATGTAPSTRSIPGSWPSCCLFSPACG